MFYYMSGEHLNMHVCSIYDNFSLESRWGHKQTGLSVLPQDIPAGGRVQGPHQVLSGEGPHGPLPPYRTRCQGARVGSGAASYLILTKLSNKLIKWKHTGHIGLHIRASPLTDQSREAVSADQTGNPDLNLPSGMLCV